ncbi:MAG: hypothetical protein HY952_04225 [Elusimicrobia bacterium]|jgi:hypothetical protein|nr:hypothetical protein [Elusimicrobiota bacterium]
MIGTLIDIGWALVFAMAGAAIGAILLIRISARIPAVFDKITPNIDEGKEIVRGNRAVADYFGRIVSAAILGVSLIIAAAVLGAMLAALR